MTQFQSAATFLADDRAAQAYVAKRRRELAALQADLKDPDNGYAVVTRIQQGFEIRTHSGTFVALSLVCVQAFVLAKFW
jgi:hypothetical protein